jgi:hypothetical protein
MGNSSIPSNPPPLLLPQQRRSRRQVEQRHLRRQRLVENRGDDVGRERGQVDHAAHVAVVDFITSDDLFHGLRLPRLQQGQAAIPAGEHELEWCRFHIPGASLQAAAVRQGDGFADAATFAVENCKLYKPDYRVCKRGGGEWCALSSACGLPQLLGDGFSIIGLFIGLVILVLGYELLLDWL